MKKEKLVLAYSGGLDTSVIVHWLNKQGYEVIALCLDLGQKVEDLDEILEKGKKAGAAKVLVENVEEEFVKDYVFSSIHWNALYEGTYLLGTSLARPLIAKKQIEINMIMSSVIQVEYVLVSVFVKSDNGGISVGRCNHLLI